MPVTTEVPNARVDGSDSGDQGAGGRLGSRGRGGHKTDLRPHRLRALWQSSIGKKYVVAVTGAIFAAWVVLHMLGNLKEIEGPGHGHASIDAYARFLKTAGQPVAPHNLVLWISRVILIVALAAHVTAVTQLWRRNRRARPRAHPAQRQRSTIAARSMTVSGALVLAFLFFHILHFTVRAVHPSAMTADGVYANVYGAFQIWWLVVVYVGAVLLLGLHMFHGLWSGAQTSGLDNPDRNWFWRRLAAGVTVFTVAGFALIPILVALDAVPAPTPHQQKVAQR